MARKYNINGNKGYIALVSILIISVILLTLAVSVSLIGFFARSNILNVEIKEQSYALAESCVHKAIVDIAIGNPPVDGLVVSFGTDPYNAGQPYTCKIIDIDSITLPGQTIIKTQGLYKKSYTNLVVVVVTGTETIVSWRETPDS